MIIYKSNDAEEWSRIFRFLRRGPQGPLTIEDVAANFDLAPTSSSSHKDIIANFEGNIVWAFGISSLLPMEFVGYQNFEKLKPNKNLYHVRIYPYS